MPCHKFDIFENTFKKIGGAARNYGSRFFVSVCISSLVLLYLYIIYVNDIWAWVAVPHLEPMFLDWHGVLAASDCHDLNYNVYTMNPCDAFDRVHAYGNFWFHIRLFGLTLADTTWSAICLVSFFVLISTYLLDPKSYSEYAISVSLLISPAFLLGLERANSDLLLFLIIVLGVYLVANENRINRSGAVVILYVATLLKIYPLVLVALSVFSGKNIYQSVIIVLVFALALFLYVFGNFQDFQYLMGTVPVPRPGGVTFGGMLLWPVLVALLDFPNFAFSTLRIATVIAFAVVTVVVAYLLRKRIRPCSEYNFKFYLYIAGVLLISFTFVMNSNYDYRCIYFVFILPFVFEHWRSKNETVGAFLYPKSILAMIIYVTWAYFLPAVGFPQLITYMEFGQESAKTIFFSLYFLEYSVTWVLVILLAAIGTLHTVDRLKTIILYRNDKRLKPPLTE